MGREAGADSLQAARAQVCQEPELVAASDVWLAGLSQGAAGATGRHRQMRAVGVLLLPYPGTGLLSWVPYPWWVGTEASLARQHGAEEPAGNA